jgi:hypothetical protein
MELLLERLELDAAFTAVTARTPSPALAELPRGGANLCLCP